MDDRKELQDHLAQPLLISNNNEEIISKNIPRRFDFDFWEAKEEVKRLGGLAVPLVVVSFLQYSMQMISLMFVGHLGELSLSSASMATSFAGVTGFNLMLGMGGALETLCGQAYGAKQYYILGIHLQRAVLVLFLTSIPIAIIWMNTTDIFLLFGQDQHISLHAGTYARWLIPSLFPYAALQCQFRFLQTQKLVTPLIVSTGFTSIIHVVSCWLLVFRLEFGNKGAALSNAISYWINVVILGAYIKFSPLCQKTWTGISKEGFKDIPAFVSLAIPSALMTCLEMWAYEILVLMSGFLPNPKLETSMMSISLNTSSVVFRIPYGFGSAVSTRVSNELGAGNPKAAKITAQVVLFLVVVEGLLIALVSMAVRGSWGYLYSNEQEVVRYMSAVMPVLTLSNFMDGIQAAMSGVARGCGWQKIGALVNLGSYYLVGLPTAIVLTFVYHYGGKGLWMGIISGSGLQAILLLTIAFRTNWKQQIIDAKRRLYHSSIPVTQIS
ncbi:OLC1v1013228C1 [Oldenlandia corymbosa var. corymbosa]|uniref:Protein DETOXIFICATION n=1 Tax=Oldenlandia corymbosa var. corymbosa TaxID=529605 RepID=A0AAV1DZT2_OLDCO|nr:OLC1v1013228C1 [Oldenlandia corymbosa var. corymbosa]